MKNLNGLLAERNIPNPLLKTDGGIISTASELEQKKTEIRSLLQNLEYGKIPPKPEQLDVRTESRDDKFCAGKASLSKLVFTAKNGDEAFSFPVYATVPAKTSGKIPAFVMINFRPDVPDKYLPAEEIVDRGYAVFSFCYKDVSDDADNFDDAGAQFLVKNREEADASGKIALWAWAAMRVMDYLETRDDIRLDSVAVAGHSRLGKTALLAAAFDERFEFAISNDSGCCGAALSRGKIGEQKENITGVFPHWFCPGFNGTEKAEELPFDQNYLLAPIIPRHILIGSAEEDLWADPDSEFLNLLSVNPIYEIYGKKGLACDDAVPQATTVLNGGDSHYHIRKGLHYFSREDWNAYMDYIDGVIKR